MKQPIAVTVDAAYPICYVEYANFDDRAEATFAIVRDGRGRAIRSRNFLGRDVLVHVDVDENDGIIGIEIVDVDDSDAVAIAHDFAAGNGLAFPDDLRAAARAFGDPAA